MKKKYKHLSGKERDFLIKMRDKYSISELARKLKRNPTTIYLFFKRNGLEFLSIKRCRLGALTLKEMEILKIAAFSTKQIAKRKMIETCTVRTYLNNIYQKFNVNNRASAILLALKKGILKLEDFEDGCLIQEIEVNNDR